ncbi:MAG: MarR family transcriptional regulator [Flavobacteriales bacterium]|nr:MarR family transcriptional regulator [Flavobacteriales bacterium]MBP9080191.1 MarR family transcriptional regulator [Flavobacteriales bacterium]
MVSLDKELNMEFKNEHQKLFLNLLFTSNWLRHMDMERLRPSGLSPQQYNILRILRGAEGRKMNMGSVLERMLDRAPNTTRLTDKLIAKGLVLRERCEEDRRVVYLTISARGMDLINSMDQETERMIGLVARKLTPSEAQALNIALDKLRS